ncbi:MAG: hypothetical protein AABX65_02390 [Nanoarchaeota archaeon]
MATAKEIEYMQECETQCIEAVKIRALTLKDDVFSVGIKERFYEDKVRGQGYFVKSLDFRRGQECPRDLDMLVFFENGELSYLPISEHWCDRRAKPFYTSAFNEAETRALEAIR